VTPPAPAALCTVSGAPRLLHAACAAGVPPAAPHAAARGSAARDAETESALDAMVKLTLIARVVDGLPLAEGLETEKNADLDAYKQQAKARGGRLALPVRVRVCSSRRPSDTLVRLAADVVQAPCGGRPPAAAHEHRVRRLLLPVRALLLGSTRTPLSHRAHARVASRARRTQPFVDVTPLNGAAT
jgi:hypothetical protein